MTTKRIVVDPLTRIEDHLRIEAMLDADNKIVEALCCGTMWRGSGQKFVVYLTDDLRNPHLGHDEIAGLDYGLFFLPIYLLQALSSFALYGESNPGGTIDTLFGWALPLFDGSTRPHAWHHLFAWGFVFFVIAHLCLVVLSGHKYDNGITTSIVSGYKFERVPDEERSDEV